MAIADVPSISNLPVDCVELRHRRRDSALAQLVAAAEASGLVQDADVLLGTLQRSLRLGRTGVGKGVALPHARSACVRRPGVVLGRSSRGIDWGAADGQEVHLVALVLSPCATRADAHVARVAGALHGMRLQRTRQRLLESDGPTAAALLRGGGA